MFVTQIRIFKRFCFITSALCFLLLVKPLIAQDIGEQAERHAQMAVEAVLADGSYLLSTGETMHVPAVQAASLHNSGGPDDFGYTWQDVAINWIDATDGTDTGLSGNSWNNAVGPIELPFSFPFYENDYQELYIVASGYIAFTPFQRWSDSVDFPLPLAPNNLIAPYTSPLTLGESGPQNRVFYKSAGEAPNRYFVVEWHQVMPEDSIRHQGQYTFELVLYENGDILFQYLEIDYGETGSRWCGNSGIENANGIDGLATSPTCGWVDSNTAIKLTRPPQGARALLYPRSQGSFTTAAATQRFHFSLQNTGALGADLYNLTMDSEWSAHIESASGDLLSDTNGDSIMDTGTLAPGSSFEFSVVIRTPAIANTADANRATITATSLQNPAVKKLTEINLTVPAPFAQLYVDGSNSSLYLLSSKPTQQSAAPLAESKYVGELAMDRLLDNRYVAIWTEGRIMPSEFFAMDVAYSIHNAAGDYVRSATWLTAENDDQYNIDNNEPLVATTPDGHIGIIWWQERRDANRINRQTNIFFAILDSNGQVMLPPTNLTQNSGFGDFQSRDVPRYAEPTIVATNENHFMIAWTKQIWPSDSDFPVTTFEYQMFSSNGIEQQAAAPLPQSELLEFSGDPHLTLLNNGQILLIYQSYRGIRYVVLNSQGQMNSSITTLEQNGWEPAATQLPGGKIIAAWRVSDYEANITRLQYGVIDGNSYQLMGSLRTIEPFAGTRHLRNVGITYNAAGQGIMTWGEQNGFYLGYLLLDESGAVYAPPAQFVSGEFTESNSRSVQVSHWRGGSHNHSTPLAFAPTAIDKSDLSLSSAAVTGGQPGGNTTIQINVSNSGLQPAEDIQLTATLDPALDFVSAEPVPDGLRAATIHGGGTYTWTLPTIDYLGGGAVVVHTSVPSTTIGATHPVTVTIVSASSDVDSSNNVIKPKVMEAIQTFLSLILR